MAGENKYIIEEFCFFNKNEYERALKEKETISYITANTDMNDMKAVLKVYNRAVEKKSFQTVIGFEFLKNIRSRLIVSGLVTAETISEIPVIKRGTEVKKTEPLDKNDASREIEKYKKAYENASTGRTIKNIIIGFLSVIIIAMIIITAKAKYSIFTYFTDYETKMENELIDKYEKWEDELEAREKALNSGQETQQNEELAE